MRKFLSYIIILLFPSILFSQNFGNQWINYNQSYVKMHITAEGVYRITATDLRAVLGAEPATQFTLPNLQVIHAGKQVPLFIQTANENGTFGNSDYIEFYAKSGNTGWLDSTVYYNYKPMNDNYSLYNDTAAYFLTFPTATACEQYSSPQKTDFQNYTALSYCLKTVRQNFNATYKTSESSPYILDGEGWGDAFFDIGTSKSKEYSLATPNFVKNTNAPSVMRFGLSGISKTQHDINVGITIETAPLRFDTTYYNYDAVHKTLQATQPLDAVTKFKFQSFVVGSKTTDKNSVSYVEVTYPHNYNFENTKEFSFTIPKQSSNAAFILLEVTNFNGGDAPILYIPEIKQRIAFTKNGEKYQVLVPNANKDLHCFALNPANVKLAKNTQWKLINTKNTKVKGKLFDIKSETKKVDYVIIAHRSQWDAALQYADYRESSGKKTLLLDVDELYDQFAYGINKHPQAIRGFIQFATNHWKLQLENVLLIGKGYKINDFRKNKTHYAATFIPPMGYPASDLLYTISPHKKEKASEYRATVNIGRIASKNSTEVLNYLEKVRLHEQQQPAEWMKTVMHFGGGSTLKEQLTIKKHLSDFEKIVSDTYFGANVSTFLKASSDVFEQTEPDIIRKNMNAGTSLLNFFGHASGSGFDQTIDDPILFDNLGKYPLIVANSCYSGDMFSPNPLGFSEKWILNTPQKGAIGFIANVDVGYAEYLSLFTSSFVKNIANANYGGSIGKSMRLSVTEVCMKWDGFDERINSVLSLSYHGDPAVAIHGFELPDFAIAPSGINFNPQVVSTDIENFNVNVTVSNKARVTSDTCLLQIKAISNENHQLITSCDTVISHLLARNTTTISFNTIDFNVGNYIVEATITPITQISRDSANKISDAESIIYIEQPNGERLPYLQLPELDKTNNSAQVNLFISAQDVLPVYPPNFAIIPHDTVSLVAVAVDPLNPPKELYWEIDTTINFNSDLRYPRTITNNTESVLIWKPNITLLDSVTYYWRIWSADSSAWHVNSFTYEAGKNGWAQQNRGQFGENTLSSNNSLANMNYDVESQRYSFTQSGHLVSCYTRNMVIPRIPNGYHPDSYYFDNRFMLDNKQLQTSGFPLGTPAFHVAVFDSITATTWRSDKGRYGQSNYGISNGELRQFFAYPSNNETYQENMANFLNDIIPNGNYILVYSFGNVKTVIPELKEAFTRLGAKVPQEDETGNYSYIFFAQKGNKNSVQEAKSINEDDILTLSANFLAKRVRGTVTTPFIGPSNHFSSIMWGKTLLDENDASSFTTMAVLPDQSNKIVVETPYAKDTVYRADTLINAHLTPFLQLRNNMQDEVDRTPPRIDFWKVYYDPVGELSINVDRKYSFHNDTIKQGDTLRMTIGAQNISIVDMDSVLVLFEIRNSSNELIVSEYKRLATAKARESVFAQFNQSTLFMPQGNYVLRVEFNPVNPDTGEYDQLENSHFNNIFHRQFVVIADEMQPSLDVTFDNRHLLNNDYVATKPKIHITLFDDNDFWPLRDTSLFIITVRNVENNVTTQYYFAGNELQFFPAESNSNFCSVLFTPTFAEGIYELSVTARDNSGNQHLADKSQPSAYTIQFRVEEKSRINTMFNFPNPARNHTTFRIVITGNTLPRKAKISIYSMQGALVQEIQLNNLHVGTNDIPFYWNSAVGKLTPGVYSYRLTFDNQDEFGSLPNESRKQITVKQQKLLVY